jgi:hypothetical protein
MQTFRDNAGRQWQLEVTVAAVKRVRLLNGVDLHRVIAREPKNPANPFPNLEEFFEDSIQVADVVWTLVESQAAAAGIDQESFGEALAGAALEAAAVALYNALGDYCPHAPTRHALKKIGEVRQRLEQQAVARVEALELGAGDSVPMASNGASASSPACSGSIPARSPGMSSRS